MLIIIHLKYRLFAAFGYTLIDYLGSAHLQYFLKIFTKLPIMLEYLRHFFAWSLVIFRWYLEKAHWGYSIKFVCLFVWSSELFGNLQKGWGDLQRCSKCSGDICTSSEGLKWSVEVFRECLIIFGYLSKTSCELWPPSKYLRWLPAVLKCLHINFGNFCYHLHLYYNFALTLVLYLNCTAL